MVKVRIAPSPTGKLHIGTARAALFNYLFAKNKGGEFILRIEDTDQKRSTKAHESDIKNGFKWLGFNWDGKVINQLDRIKEGVYEEKLNDLIDKGFVYPCFCSSERLKEERAKQRKRGIPPKYSGRCRNLSEEEVEKKLQAGQKPTYRLSIDQVAQEKDLGEFLSFKDQIRGLIESEIEGIGDFILVKEDGTPLYQFAVVVDDYLMEISHVIRGEDHITNTFNQLLLYGAFDWELPKFAHLPLILDKDKSKLSKRGDNIVTIEGFKKAGYLPEALVNYMTLLGWSPTSEGKEVFSLKEAIKEFKLKDVNSSPAIFEYSKLDYLNGYYIRQKSDQKLLKLLEKNQKVKVANKEYYLKVVSLVKDRMKKLSDFSHLSKYFFKKPDYSLNLLVFDKSTKKKTAGGLKLAQKTLKSADKSVWQDPEKINNLLAQAVEKSDLENGDLFWPVRAALSGREASPSPSELLWALEKEESLARLKTALEKIS